MKAYAAGNANATNSVTDLKLSMANGEHVLGVGSASSGDGDDKDIKKIERTTSTKIYDREQVGHHDIQCDCDTCCTCCKCCSAERFYGILWMTIGCGTPFYCIILLFSKIFKFCCAPCIAPCGFFAADMNDVSTFFRDPFIVEIFERGCAGVGGLIFNILWFPIGIILCILHLIFGLIWLPFHIIGVPFGLAHFKLAYIALRPMGLVLNSYNLTCVGTCLSCGGCRDIYTDSAKLAKVWKNEIDHNKQHESKMTQIIDTADVKTIVKQEGGILKEKTIIQEA